ncbi:unnamed protein product [Mytilus coruscus]|uniref:Zinc finger PHD-type domain-containing protein n=1 Tax=Mytilus coruscus TaxID=42192 RepID=A0A6J8BJI3_MYTCO|nr:unnamed protein product [Mytilus coruscus]
MYFNSGYDDTSMSKRPTDFGHECPGYPCVVDSIDNDSFDTYDKSLLISLQTNPSPISIDETREIIKDDNSEKTSPKQLIIQVGKKSEEISDLGKDTCTKGTNLNIDIPTTATSNKVVNVGLDEKKGENLDKKKTNTSTNKTECTQMCNEIANCFMIQCDKCQRWTNYKCTKLPAYQLYMLENTSRKYTCKTCTNVPRNFSNKWEPSSNTEEKNNLLET